MIPLFQRGAFHWYAEAFRREAGAANVAIQKPLTAR